jgi:methyltransferase (TIGR00027 family)
MTRTDTDTWDLATSVGATATMVAAGRALASRTGLIDDRFAEPLVRAVGIDFFTRWADGDLDPAEIDAPDQPWGLRQMTNLMAARTRHMDEFFADATAAGIRQAVILASGLDARGYRLSWPSGMTVFEIDQPDVLHVKSATLDGLGARPTATLRAVPVDLRQDWPSALREAGFDPAQPTAWLAEGLLPFLPPQAQDRLLDTITELSAAGSRLLTEMFMASPGAQQIMRETNQRWYDNGLRVHLDNLMYDAERNDVAGYLADRGWRTSVTHLTKLLTDNGLPAPPRRDDQMIENQYCTAALG